MKKYQLIPAALLLAGATLFTTGCRDDFAETNTDPSTISEGNVGYLFAQGVLEFDPSDYTYWFYNANQIYQWMQIMVSTGGVTSLVHEGGAGTGGSIDVFKYLNEIKYVRSQMPEEESAAYAQYEAAMDVLCVYMGIFDTDFIGDIPYTEAAQALHGGTLTPNYDRVADLYDLWLNNLDADIAAFTTATDQSFEGAQDPVYGGQADKWAKLANSLKLKIAARLLSQDRARALQIAQEVATASCGVLDGESDDFFFNKASYNSSSNDYAYHWSNGVLQSVGASQPIIDLMVRNRDPRVRFIFQKNDWNSRVVQQFIDAGRTNDIPQYIMDNINLDANGDFESWKAPGEPWVRYYGLPLAFNAGQQAGTYGDWFNYDTQCLYDNSRDPYYPFSRFQQEQIYGRIDFTLPTAVGDAIIQDTDDMPWYGKYMTTSEVNLYLAEFALLGAALPQSAEAYYDKALRASVEEYDRMASLNRIPYYGTTYNYDPNEVAIDLQAGEIDEMMSHEEYQLTGDVASDLEKVYIQQILNFMELPVEVWVTCRRSGVPKLDSDIWQRVDYAANGLPTVTIPRRTALSAPAPTDLMYDIELAAYAAQGYSIGSANNILNTERVWQDQGAPQYGEGPQL